MRTEKMRRLHDDLVAEIVYVWGLYHLIRFLFSY